MAEKQTPYIPFFFSLDMPETLEFTSTVKGGSRISNQWHTEHDIMRCLVTASQHRWFARSKDKPGTRASSGLHHGADDYCDQHNNGGGGATGDNWATTAKLAAASIAATTEGDDNKGDDPER